jgi:hypothetical protein
MGNRSSNIAAGAPPGDARPGTRTYCAGTRCPTNAAASINCGSDAPSPCTPPSSDDKVAWFMSIRVVLECPAR